jgi:tetratricopeptide (TPR) repeat protein
MLMTQHLTDPSLADFFQGIMTIPDSEAHIAHLVACRPCWVRAAAVLKCVQTSGKLTPTSLASAVVRLLRAEERHEDRMRQARCLLSELKESPPNEQRKRLRSVVSIHNQVFFKAILEEAAVLWHTDPGAAEHFAHLARELAAILPNRQFSEPLRNDLQAEALTYLANCRRLTADWEGAREAIAEARAHLRRGTSSSQREALLLSMSAALAVDVGQTERALSLLARSGALYRSAGDYSGMARAGAQEANAHLAVGSAETALERAEEVLSLPGLDTRIEMLAKGVAIQALIILGRTREASGRFSDYRDLFSQFPESVPRLAYIEARLLEAAGHFRDAERRMRDAIQAFLDVENYKAAFDVYLNFFEIFFKRRAFSKAIELCEEVLGNDLLLSGRPSIRRAWEDLLSLVRARSLDVAQLAALRQFCLRYWNTAAPHGPFTSLAVAVAPLSEVEESAVEAEASPAVIAAPAKREALLGDAYHEALQERERELFTAALEACGYSIRRTARVLKMSRTTVKDRIQRFGLESLLSPDEI